MPPACRAPISVSPLPHVLPTQSVGFTVITLVLPLLGLFSALCFKRKDDWYFSVSIEADINQHLLTFEDSAEGLSQCLWDIYTVPGGI